MTHIASIPTKNFGGQKQLISNPIANTIAIRPLFVLLNFLRIFIPPILYNNQKLNFCYKKKQSVYEKQTVLIIIYILFAKHLYFIKSICDLIFRLFG